MTTYQEFVEFLEDSLGLKDSGGKSASSSKASSSNTSSSNTREPEVDGSAVDAFDLLMQALGLDKDEGGNWCWIV